MVDSVKVEDVDLLSEAVHYVEVVRDPVHRHRDGTPGTGHTVKHKGQISEARAGIDSQGSWLVTRIK